MNRRGAFELVTLRSGEKAVRHVGHGEVMHPGDGPWGEANGLYVDGLGLRARLAAPDPSPLRILDVGLGAAANAAAVILAARAAGGRHVELVSLERDLDALRLARSDEAGFPFLVPLARELDALLARGAAAAPGLSWRLLEGDALARLGEAGGGFELVLFDPFSPKQDGGLWTPEALAAIRGACRRDGPGAALATYSAATPTRASLLVAGFFVGAGPATGRKGETTLAATRLDLLERPLGARWLARWERSSARAPHGTALSPAIEAAIRGHPQLVTPGRDPA